MIFVTTRTQDIAEKRVGNLIVSMLDWEKAFDRIQHDNGETLNRLGIHPRTLLIS